MWILHNYGYSYVLTSEFMLMLILVVCLVKKNDSIFLTVLVEFSQLVASNNYSFPIFLIFLGSFMSICNILD